MRILAVDDEPFILELIPMLAARVGFPDVTTVTSGARALQALGQAGALFDCLVLDINMPQMDGIALCHRIRQLAAYRKTPILMLTAMSDRDFMEAAFKAGATDYVTKPFDIHELGARLRVANELVQAHRAASPRQTEHRLALDLAEAVDLDMAGQVLEFGAFTNYLKQVSRAGTAALQILAVKIDRVDQLHARTTADEFCYALREVAFAVAEGLRTLGCLITYAGSGVFVVVSSSATPLDAPQIESAVQEVLDDRNAAGDDGQPLDIEVSVGAPIQPNFGDQADCPRSIDRATARAEYREAAKRQKPRDVTIRRTGG